MSKKNTVMNEEVKDNVINLTDQEPVKEADVPAAEGEVKEEMTIFGKWDRSIMAKRKAKADKKAAKKELSKGEKAARIGAGVAVGAAVIGGVGKVLFNHFVSGDTVELMPGEISETAGGGSADAGEPVMNTNDASMSVGEF